MPITSIFDRLSEEFEWKYLFFEHDFPTDFVNSQWQSDSEPDILFLIYRACHLLGFLLAFCFCYRYSYLIAFGDTFMYLTNWSYVLGIANSSFGLVCVARRVLHRKVYLVHDFPWWYKCYWALHSTTLDLCFAVSLGYWAVKHLSLTVKPLGVDQYHIWNSVLMLLDLFMVSIPLRLAHVYNTLFVGLMYAALTAVYFVHGYENNFNKLYIYHITDWKNLPSITLLATVIGATYLVLLRILVFMLYLLRCWIHRTYFLEFTPQSLSSFSLADYSIADATV